MENINNLERFVSTGGFSLNRIVYFVAVVETGSFTRAADRLGITKAVVSQQIARLEADFKTALLVRSTRHVRTTEAGSVFYQRCAQLIKEADQAFHELSATARTPSGTLRLTAPVDYGMSVILPAITQFSALYPECQVEAHFSDEILTLNASQYDLAIRAGWLKEQYLQVRKLGIFGQKMVVSPRWQPQISSITSPDALLQIPFIANTALNDPERLELSQGQQKRQTLTLKSALRFNTTLATREAAIQGAGLAILPDYVADKDIAAGTLLAVLPSWELPQGEIHAVYPTTSYRPVKVSAFVDILLSNTNK